MSTPKPRSSLSNSVTEKMEEWNTAYNIPSRAAYSYDSKIAAGLSPMMLWTERGIDPRSSTPSPETTTSDSTEVGPADNPPPTKPKDQAYSGYYNSESESPAASDTDTDTDTDDDAWINEIYEAEVSSIKL